MKDNIVKRSIITIFVSLYVLVATISTIHLVDFFLMSNPEWLAITLAISFEIGAAACLAAIIILDKTSKAMVWSLFILITLVQMSGNMYYAYIHLQNYQGRIELFGLIEEDAILQKRVLSAVSGAILPIVALGFIKSLVDYIKPETIEEEVEIEQIEEELENEEPPIIETVEDITQVVEDVAADVVEVKQVDEIAAKEFIPLPAVEIKEKKQRKPRTKKVIEEVTVIPVKKDKKGKVVVPEVVPEKKSKKVIKPAEVVVDKTAKKVKEAKSKLVIPVETKKKAETKPIKDKKTKKSVADDKKAKTKDIDKKIKKVIADDPEIKKLISDKIKKTEPKPEIVTEVVDLPVVETVDDIKEDIYKKQDSGISSINTETRKFGGL